MDRVIAVIERGQTLQDPDMDGLNNYQELFWGTDPRNADTDGDSYKSNFRDGTEVNYWMKKGYGVTEIRQYSSTRDSDSDGLRDGWEVYYGLNPASSSGSHGGYGDPDGDGLTNYYEQYHVTDPKNPDTDGDGLSDYQEIYVYGTDPKNPDTDGDSMLDGWEVALGENPLTYKEYGFIHGGPGVWKLLTGRTVEAGFIFSASQDDWFDFADLAGMTTRGKQNKVTHWKVNEWGFGIGVQVGFGAMLVYVDKDYNGDGVIDQNDYPDLDYFDPTSVAGLIKAVSNPSDFSLAVGIGFGLAVGSNCLGGFVTIGAYVGISVGTLGYTRQVINAPSHAHPNKYEFYSVFQGAYSIV